MTAFTVESKFQLVDISMSWQFTHDPTRSFVIIWLDASYVRRLFGVEDVDELRHTQLELTASLKYNQTNPLHAELFWGKIKSYLHALSFLNIEMVQLVEFLPRGRQGPIYPT